ncbi:MAG: NAD(P)H-hydrate epimerase [Candidatus Brocadiia bacterium]
MSDTIAFTREQMRELDRAAIEEYGIPGLILMENAGRACAEAASEMLGGAQGNRVLVLAGKGNNGGDGFVVARHLSNWCADVQALLLSGTDEVLAGGGDAAANLRIALAMDIPIQEAATADAVRIALRARPAPDLLVDALLGTGINGEVREPFAGAIAALNEADAPVLAVDIPSGLDCDTGEPLGAAVHADRTVTFGALKVGMTRPGAEQFTGPVTVAEISIPRQLIAAKVQQWQLEEG